MTFQNMSQLQDLFRVGPENPITLRAIGGGAVENLMFAAQTYPSVDDRWAAFAVEAERLNSAGYNIYTCLNPIKPEFAGVAVSDNDISCRRLLLIDLDRAGSPKVPATDDEIRLAFDVSENIQAWFEEREGVVPTRALSGNGIHLYYQLDDLPNDDTSHMACKALLSTLAATFDTSEVKVDKVVHNASRITKVPGTKAYKGQAGPDRPYRTAVIL